MAKKKPATEATADATLSPIMVNKIPRMDSKLYKVPATFDLAKESSGTYPVPRQYSPEIETLLDKEPSIRPLIESSFKNDGIELVPTPSADGNSISLVAVFNPDNFTENTLSALTLNDDGSPEFTNMVKMWKELTSDLVNEESIRERTNIALDQTQGDLLLRLKADPLYNPPTPEKDHFYVEPLIWYTCLVNALSGINTMLIGESGTGKTSLVKKITEVLEKRFTVKDMGSAIDPVMTLHGVHRLKDGKSVFDYAPFVEEVQIPNSIILLDELNRAPAGTMNFLIPALDWRRQLEISIASSEGQRTVDVHPSTVFFATGNVGSQYSGARPMDVAIEDRFQIVELRYITEKEEARVLDAIYGIGDVESKKIAHVATLCRKSEKLDRKPSTRQTLAAARYVKLGFTLKEALQITFLPMYTSADLADQRQEVETIISTK